MKYHFANSRDPLKEHSTIKAICGVKVPKATFAAMAEMVDWGHVEFNTNCRKCNKLSMHKRFVYVIAPGQEAMNVSGDASSTPVSL